MVPKSIVVNDSGLGGWGAVVTAPDIETVLVSIAIQGELFPAPAPTPGDDAGAGNMRHTAVDPGFDRELGVAEDLGFGEVNVGNAQRGTVNLTRIAVRIGKNSELRGGVGI